MGAKNEHHKIPQRGGLLDGFIIPLSSRLRQFAYLRAIRDSFCLLMPFIILLTLLHMLGFLVVVLAFAFGCAPSLCCDGAAADCCQQAVDCCKDAAAACGK